MKKICFITTVSTTMKSFVLPVAEYLCGNTEWEITVICDHDPALAECLPEGIRYHPIPMKRGISLGGLRALCAMYRVFRSERFDLIQYSTPNAAFYAAIAGMAAGIRVRNYHLMGFRYLGCTGVKRWLLKLIERVCCACSTHIECVSPSNLALGIRERIFPAAKATVVWNGSSSGVDLRRFCYEKKPQWRAEIREKLGYSQEDYIYGFVGRITRDKGLNELLRAHTALNSGDRLLLIGDLEQERDAQPQLREGKNSETVFVHPRVDEIERYFAAIDVLVLPSYREGFGTVIIEAAAMGVPAIVSEIPGPIDAVEPERTALTVPVRDWVSLRDAMERIKGCDTDWEGQCVAFVKERFDSEVLFEKIKERKSRLLGK